MENTGEKGNRGIKNPSRRKFLGNAVKGAAGAVLASSGIVKAADFISKVPTPDPLPRVKAQDLPSEAYNQPDNEKPDLDAFKNSLKSDKESPSSSPTPTITDNPEEKGEEITVEVVNRELFPKYTSEEIEILNRKVNTAVDYFKNERYRGEGSLEQAVTSSLQWKDLVKENLKEMDFDKDFLNSKVPDLITSLIFVESEGNPEAYNTGSGATGLMQIMPVTAEELARDLNEPNYDLTDPDTSIEFGLAYLSKMYKYYPDAGLDLWVYHLGMGNLLNVVKAKMGNQQIGFDTIAQVIIRNHLNLANLIESPYTQEQVASGVFGDKTEEYASRVLAGYFFQKQHLAGQLKS